jgi:hypothetical protein
MLECPFCRRPIEEPQEITSRFGSTFSGGKCDCGAVYVYDESGHHVGDAYVDALAFAFNDDLDKAWSYTPGEDYEIIELSYDKRRNRFVREISGGRGRTIPVFLFLLNRKESHGDKEVSDVQGKENE